MVALVWLLLLAVEAGPVAAAAGPAFGAAAALKARAPTKDRPPSNRPVHRDRRIDRDDHRTVDSLLRRVATRFGSAAHDDKTITGVRAPRKVCHQQVTERSRRCHLAGRHARADGGQPNGRPGGWLL